MRSPLIEVLILVIPFLISLFWFFYWIIRIQRKRRELESKRDIHTAPARVGGIAKRFRDTRSTRRGSRAAPKKTAS